MTRANRVLWTVIALILMAAGVIGILVNLGHFPGTDKDVPLLTDRINSQFRSWDGWAVGVTIAAGVVIAVLGIALIRAESRRRGGKSMPDLTFAHTLDELNPADAAAGAVPIRGSVQVSGRTLRHALQQDLQKDPRIKHAGVRLTGRPAQPRLHLDLAVTASADLPTVHEYVAGAVTRFRTTSQLQPTLAETTIRLA